MPKYSRRRPSLRIFKILGSHQKWRCGSCDTLLDNVAEVDHKTPLSQGGTNDIDNLEILCVLCHALKTQKECVDPFMDRSGAMHCRFCRTVYSKFFSHACPWHVHTLQYTGGGPYFGTACYSILFLRESGDLTLLFIDNPRHPHKTKKLLEKVVVESANHFPQNCRNERRGRHGTHFTRRDLCSQKQPLL